MVIQTDPAYIKWYKVGEMPTPPTNCRLLVAVSSGDVFIAQKRIFDGWIIWYDDKKVKLKTIDPVLYWSVLPKHPDK